MIYKYIVIEDNPTAIETLNILMEDFEEFKKENSTFYTPLE